MKLKKLKITTKALCLALCCVMLLPMLFSCSGATDGTDSGTGTQSTPNTSGDPNANKYLDVVLPEFDFKGTDLTQYLTLPSDMSDRDYTEGLTLLGTPSEEDIQEQIKLILKNYATKTEPADAVVEDGDRVVMDYVGTQDGIAFPGGSSSNTEHDISIENSTFIEGFDKGLIGMKVGEKKDLNLTFPDPYPNNSSLAGAKVVFTVTIKKIIKFELPELTDQLIADNREDFDESIQTAQDVVDAIRRDMTEQYKSTDESSILDAAWKYLVDESEIKSYPEGLLEGYKQACYASYYNTALQSGMTLEQYAQANNYLDEAAFTAAVIDTEAEGVLKTSMVLYASAKALNVTVTEEDARAFAQLEFDEYILPNIDYYKNYLGISNLEEMLEYVGGIEVYEEQLMRMNVLCTITDIEMPDVTGKGDSSEEN